MERIYGPGKWIEATVRGLTLDEGIRDIFRDILDRTIGVAADNINFPYDRYSAPDGIGRPEKADAIGQWLCTEARLDRKVLAEPATAALLRDADLDDIWKHATARLAEIGLGNLLPSVEGDEETILEYVDGYRLVSLKRPEAVSNEYHASKMAGAVDDSVSTWVLRDEENVSVAMLVVDRNTVVAMRGAGGMRVPFHVTEAYLLGVIDDRGMDLVEPTTIHGAVRTANGRIHDLRDIPAGSTIDGDLWIRDEGHLLSRLPDNLTVNGDFGLFKSTYLTATPRNFKVSGNCGFVDCPGLKTIASGMTVGGWTHLKTCRSLNRIEDDVDFGESVIFSSEISTLEAKPFRAAELVIRGRGVDACLKGRDIPRDRDGRVIIDGEFVQKAVNRQFRKELAQLPSLAASVVYHGMKQKIRRGVRAMTNAGKVREAESEDDQSTKPPMR